MLCSLHEGGELLALGNKASSCDEGYQKILTALRNGSAMAKFKEMITIQGVDKRTADKLCGASNFFEVLPLSKYKTEVKADVAGTITSINAETCAQITSALGAGRTKPGEAVLHNVGIIFQNHVGDVVSLGENILTVYHKHEVLEEEVKERLKNSVNITQDVNATRLSRFLHKISSK